MCMHDRSSVVSYGYGSDEDPEAGRSGQPARGQTVFTITLDALGNICLVRYYLADGTVGATLEPLTDADAIAWMFEL